MQQSANPILTSVPWHPLAKRYHSQVLNVTKVLEIAFRQFRRGDKETQQHCGCFLTMPPDHFLARCDMAGTYLY
jgi:hypothetical protein